MAAAAASEAVRPTPDRRETPFAINDLDLVFVMDTTGSMRNELADVQANLLGVIRVLARLAPSLRVGFVAFKDHGAAYVTQSFRLSPMSQDNVVKVIRFVGQMSAEGGGDDPEPVDEALAVATAMDWRPDAQGQIVVIGDAPVRPAGRATALALAERFPGLGAGPRPAAVGIVHLHRRGPGCTHLLRAARACGRRRLQRL